MSAYRPLPISPEELLVVVSDLWDVAFRRPVMAIDVDPEPHDAVWGRVDIVDSTGAVAEVTVVCNGQVHRTLARAIFGVDEPEPDQSLAVAAEAANIVAGNVKGIVQLRTSLSLPRAGTGMPPSPCDAAAPSCRQLLVRAGDGDRRRVLVRLVDRFGARSNQVSSEEETTS